MPYDEFLTFMFFDWNIFSMQDKKNTIQTEKKKINIHIATGKHPLSFLSKDHAFTFLNFQTLSKHAYLK